MLKIDKVIIVEGKYDKIKLSKFIDALIIPTNGFRIFKDKEKKAIIKKLADEKGIIILTDSDSAGFLIRNKIKSFIAENKIINVYIPQIKGKEKRKNFPSKEGLLGVEGLTEEILIKVFEKSKINMIDTKGTENKLYFSQTKLYEDGLAGHTNSKLNREKFLKILGLPSYISTKAFIEYLNYNVSPEKYIEIIKTIDML